jgi:hypothetical protein
MNLLKIFVAAVLLLGCCSTLSAWGPRAHRIVNDKAIDSLPPEIRNFYASQRPAIVDHAYDAKIAANKNHAEEVRHFIYFDRYGKYPFPMLPHNYNMAKQQYGSLKLNKNGILPWYIGEYHLRLTEAFRTRNWDAVREISAWLAHYVADDTDPFLLTENFNGQMSGQNGVGDRISATLLDRFANFLLIHPGRAQYIKDPTENAFQLGLENFVWLDNFLLADRRSFESAGGYNDDYYERLYNEVGPIVSRQLSEAIESVASYWYTAWINGGKPALPSQ